MNLINREVAMLAGPGKPAHSRRALLRGLGALLVAPAIVRASSLMPVRVPRFDVFVNIEKARTLTAWYFTENLYGLQFGLNSALLPLMTTHHHESDFAGDGLLVRPS